MKAISKYYSRILEEIMCNIVPIKTLNTRVFKPRWTRDYIEININNFYDEGNIINISKIKPEKNGPYYKIHIIILKLFLDGKYYPVSLLNTKNKYFVKGINISKTNKIKYKCINSYIQEALIDYVELFLKNIYNLGIQ